MKWRWLLTGIGACVVLAVGLLWPRGQAHRLVRLSNGETIALVAVTYGKEHSASVRTSTFKERIAGLLRVRPRVRDTSVSTNTERDTLVVWIWVTNHLSFSRAYSAFVAATNGVKYQTTRPLAESWNPRKGWLEGMAVEAFPRGEKEFTLLLTSRYRQAGQPDRPVLAEVTLRNPAPSHAPPWAGRPLPQRVGTAEFDCVLERCELELRKPTTTPLRMRFRFFEQGQAVWHWRVQKVELEDATGNFLPVPWELGTSFEKQGPADNMFESSLLPGTGAWKVRAFVQRMAGFASNEVWEVRNMPVLGQPGHGQSTWRTNLGGVSFALKSLAATNRYPTSVGAPNRASQDFITFEVDSPDGMERAQLVALEDDRGQPGTSRGMSHGDRAAGWLREWDKSATSATVRIGISPWRVVEFLVEPKVLGP